MSIFMLCAAPVIAEPAAKQTMNPSRIGFRPKLETKRPIRGRTAVEAIVYALPAQMKSLP